jgi:hypothetical protein
MIFIWVFVVLKNPEKNLAKKQHITFRLFTTFWRGNERFPAPGRE